MGGVDSGGTDNPQENHGELLGAMAIAPLTGAPSGEPWRIGLGDHINGETKREGVSLLFLPSSSFFSIFFFFFFVFCFFFFC